MQHPYAEVDDLLSRAAGLAQRPAVRQPQRPDERTIGRMDIEYDLAAIDSAAANVDELARIDRGAAEPNRGIVEQRLCAHVLLHHRLAPDERRHAPRDIAYLARKLGATTPDQMWAIVASHYPDVERRHDHDQLLNEVAAVPSSEELKASLVEDGRRLLSRLRHTELLLNQLGNTHAALRRLD
uniref:Uncharacterized protein n=2 Tax=Mycolicibacterium TaxID=1866885 RepID=A0A343VQX4_9MYCO|nr:hypothetical protein B5P44_p00003 [Mycolicibacterium sp. CBMA 213]